jgi:hypothetical protein
VTLTLDHHRQRNCAIAVRINITFSFTRSPTVNAGAATGLALREQCSVPLNGSVSGGNRR